MDTPELGVRRYIARMNSKSKPFIRLLLLCAAAFALNAPAAHAEMLGPERALEAPGTGQADQDRAKVRQLLERTDVSERLKALGVDASNAHERVDAMSDEEVHALAQRIDSMPAGGNLSQNDIILILLVAILIIVAL